MVDQSTLDGIAAEKQFIREALAHQKANGQLWIQSYLTSLDRRYFSFSYLRRLPMTAYEREAVRDYALSLRAPAA